MASNNTWNPDDDDFIPEMVGTGVGLVAAGVVTLAAFVLFFIIRFMCCCCGKGACAKNETAGGKTRVMGYRIVAALLLVGALIGGILLATTGEKFSSSLSGLTQTVVAQVNLTIDDVRNVTSAVDGAVPGEFNLDVSSLSDSEAELVEVSVKLDDAEADAAEVFDQVKQLIVAFGAIVVASAVVGVLSLARPAPFMLTVFLLFAFVVAPTCWFLSGIGSITHVASTDVCNMMALHAAGARNAWIDAQLRCDDLAEARTAANDMMRASNDQIASANEAVEESNEAVTVASAASIAAGDSSPLVDTQLPTLCLPFANDTETGDWRVAFEQTTGVCTALQEEAITEAYDPYVCGLPGVTSKEDATYNACVQAGTPLLQPDVDTMVAAARSFAVIAAALPTVMFLASCGFIDRAFAALVADDCDDVQTHTHLLYTGAFVAALFLTLVSFLFCVCFRNLRKQPQTKVEYTVGSPTHQPLIAAMSPTATPAATGMTNPYFGGNVNVNPYATGNAHPHDTDPYATGASTASV